MIATTLIQANQIKAASPVPMVVKNHTSGYRLESLYHSLTLQQIGALAVANELYVSYGKCTYLGSFHPIQFEIYDVVAKGKGAALANALRQLGLLQNHNGRYWISPAGLNLINSIDNVLEH